MTTVTQQIEKLIRARNCFKGPHRTEFKSSETCVMLHSFPVAAIRCAHKVPYTDGSKIRDVLFHHSISNTKSRPWMVGQCYIIRPLKGRFLPCHLASPAAGNPDKAL